MGKFVELGGEVFAHLTVLERDNDRGGGIKPVVKWLCRCECGKIVSVKGDSLKTGHTQSCGCKKIKHGYAHKERLYETWKNMRRRCNDPRNTRYAQYGGRGIRICPEWNEYQAFRDWAHASGYNDTLTIDRINVDGNYCPSNCRWADYKVQANNVSRNRIIEHRGMRMTVSEWADYLGITYSSLQHRLDRGWNMERIECTPQRKRDEDAAS